MTANPKSLPDILSAKLNRPKVTRDLLPRPRLMKLLDLGLQASMTLVTAPAGFGKTTLVSSWVATLCAGGQGKEGGLPSAWLALDEDDSDVFIYLNYFIAALRTIFPDACPKSYVQLHAANWVYRDALSKTLSNEIETLPLEFVLVLDDHHRVHNPVIYDHLADWMRHWPRGLHLVILSRYSLPLPLADLRASGNLLEIRSQDLRFSPEESFEYLRQRVEASVDEATLTLLGQHMEGWIAGLKLATLSLARSSDPHALATALSDGRVYITDYLMEEVLAHQSPAVQQFLLRTSITERFSSSLCEELMGGAALDRAVRQLLDEIEAADLFLTRLDDRREWYRYHQIFREFLRRKLLTQLGGEQVNELHLRAASWYAGHNLADEALSHALQASDLGQAAEFMYQGLCEVLNREDFQTLERWLRLFPNEMVWRNPKLMLIKAWENLFRWDIPQTVGYAYQAEALLQEGSNWTIAEPEPLRGQIAAFKGQAAYHLNQPELAITLCQEALALLPEGWRYPRGLAAVYLGLSLYSARRINEARNYLVALYLSEEDKSNGFALRLLIGLAVNDLQACRFDEAEQTAKVLLQQAQQSQHKQMEGWSRCLLGYIYYLWNELTLAEQNFQEAHNLRFYTTLFPARSGLIGLALTYLAQGNNSQASASVALLREYDVRFMGSESIETSAARARLYLQQGDLEAAERWAAQLEGPAVDQALLPGMEEPQMTRVRVLIAGHRTADVRSALQILDQLSEIAGRTFNQRALVEILSLRAMAQLALGDAVTARASLIQALKLARDSGIIRLFVDLGSQMHKLLLQVAEDRSVSKTVGRILAAYPGASQAQAGGGFKTPTTNTDLTPSGDEMLYGRLTPRELGVLKLMAESLRIDEIADRLSISYATAKRHTHNIYTKFDVHDRRAAVTFAIQHGILPPR